MDTFNKVEVIKLLDGFTTKLNLVQSLDELALTIEEILERVIQVEYTALYLFDFSNNRLKLFFAKGFTEEEKIEAERTAMERHPGKAFNEKRTIVIANSSESNKYGIVENEKTFKGNSRVYAPVMNGDEPVGVFGLASSEENKFNEEHTAVLSFVGNLAGVIYKNLDESNLYRITKERLKLHDRALESSNNGIVISDATQHDNPITYVNKAFEEITGYSYDEVVGTNCRFLQGEDKNQPGLEKLRYSLKYEEPCRVILKNFKKDGQVFWNELSISPIRDQSGRTTHFIGIQTDITRRRMTELGLEEATQRLGLLIQNLRDGILVEDQFRKIVLVNDEFLRLFKIPLPSEDMIGVDCVEAGQAAKVLFSEEEEFIKRVDEILKEKRPVTNEELELKDGSIFERTYIPIFIQSDYRGHLWQYRDVTSKRQASLEIKKLKAFYEKILNDLPGQIAVFNHDLKYLYLNPASVKNDEIREWLIGKDDLEYCDYRNIHKSIGESRQEKLKAVKEQKKAIKFEETMHMPDGEVKYFIREISPIIDEDGEVTQLLAYGVDITQRKSAEIELARSQQQLKSVLETVGEGIITINTDSKIVMINKEVEIIWGYSRDELIGQDITSLMPEKYRSMHHNGMQRYISTRKSHVLNQKLELEGMRKNGTVFPLEITIQETMIGGDLFFTAAMHDISELRVLLSKLESSNKSLTEFAYIASHDLREPLRKISSFGGLLEMSLAEKLEADDKENLEFMIDGAQRMQQMIDDLLSYSKITKPVDEYFKVNLDEVIEEIIDFELYQSIKENDAEIIVENELGILFGEKTQFKQVFQNLILNAIKYKKPGEKPVVKVRSKVEPGLKIFEFEDNGQGIDHKYQKQVFEMFKRLHSKDDVSGSGIGLSVCKKIVEIYGGNIEIESEPAKGSVFIVSIPFH